MAKITVYLQDELAEKMEKHKDFLNVSETCQEALGRELETLDIVTGVKDGTNMEKVIARLTKEKRSYEDGWEETGRKDGAIDAKDLDYATLKELGSDEFPVSYYEHPWSVLPEDIREAIEESLKDDKTDSGYWQIDNDAYARGWLLSIREFWNHIADKV